MVVDNPPEVPSDGAVLPPSAPINTNQQATAKSTKAEAYTKSKEFAQYQNKKLSFTA